MIKAYRVLGERFNSCNGKQNKNKHKRMVRREMPLKVNASSSIVNYVEEGTPARDVRHSEFLKLDAIPRDNAPGLAQSDGCKGVVRLDWTASFERTRVPVLPPPIPLPYPHAMSSLGRTRVQGP